MLGVVCCSLGFFTSQQVKNEKMIPITKICKIFDMNLRNFDRPCTHKHKHTYKHTPMHTQQSIRIKNEMALTLTLNEYMKCLQTTSRKLWNSTEIIEWKTHNLRKSLNCVENSSRSSWFNEHTWRKSNERKKNTQVRIDRFNPSREMCTRTHSSHFNGRYKPFLSMESEYSSQWLSTVVEADCRTRIETFQTTLLERELTNSCGWRHCILSVPNINVMIWSMKCDLITSVLPFNKMRAIVSSDLINKSEYNSNFSI